MLNGSVLWLLKGLLKATLSLPFLPWKLFPISSMYEIFVHLYMTSNPSWIIYPTGGYQFLLPKSKYRNEFLYEIICSSCGHFYCSSPNQPMQDFDFRVVGKQANGSYSVSYGVVNVEMASACSLFFEFTNYSLWNQLKSVNELN